MRGKVSNVFLQGLCTRITPAYAGKSSHLCKSFHGHRDHPRLCGEKSCTSSRVRSGTGSPPPMRGKANSGFPTIDRYRITPAYAGKRITMAMLVTSGKDHPRLCGEKQKRFIRRTARSGSPPPMRGKVSISIPIPFSERITPAYAGKRHSERFALYCE